MILDGRVLIVRTEVAWTTAITTDTATLDNIVRNVYVSQVSMEARAPLDLCVVLMRTGNFVAVVAIASIINASARKGTQAVLVLRRFARICVVGSVYVTRTLENANVSILITVSLASLPIVLLTALVMESVTSTASVSARKVTTARIALPKTVLWIAMGTVNVSPNQWWTEMKSEGCANAKKIGRGLAAKNMLALPAEQANIVNDRCASTTATAPTMECVTLHLTPALVSMDGQGPLVSSNRAYTTAITTASATTGFAIVWMSGAGKHARFLPSRVPTAAAGGGYVRRVFATAWTDFRGKTATNSTMRLHSLWSRRTPVSYASLAALSMGSVCL